jgi:type IV pilus assembly protein PilY1
MGARLRAFTLAIILATWSILAGTSQAWADYTISSFTSSVSEITELEGATGTFTVALTGPVAAGESVTFSVTPSGSATAGSDYTMSAASITIGEGESSGTVVLTVKNDALVESRETVAVSISAISGNVTSPGTVAAALAIDDDGDKYQVDGFTGWTGSESAGPATLTVHLNQPVRTGDTVIFDVSHTPGSASAGSDYTAPAATVQIVGNGSIQEATVNVALPPDDIVESTETFQVNISANSANVVVDGYTSATVTITDDDKYQIDGFTGWTGSESAGPATLTVHLNQPVRTGDTVIFDVSHTPGSASAGSDYTAPASTLQIVGNGSIQEATVSVPLVNDAIVESTETFQVNISANSANVVVDGYTSATVTITDDDKYQVDGFTGWTGSESAGPATLTVHLNQPVRTGDTVIFDVSHTPGSATAGSDYTAPASTLQIVGNGSIQEATVSVPLVNDAIVESTETFQVGITANSANVAVDGYTSATVTITDDDKYQVDGFTGWTGYEYAGAATLTVHLNQPVRTGDTVIFAVSHNPVSASTGSDYTAPAATVQIVGNGGTQSASISVPLVNDAVVESTETFQVGISANSANVVVGGYTSATATIYNDDKYTFTFGSPSVIEPTGSTTTLAVPFTISPAIQTEHAGSTIAWRTWDGSATSGADFVSGSGTISLNSGMTSGSVNITINPDALDEAAEYFWAGVTSGGSLPTSQWAVAAYGQPTITDNDNQVTPSWNADGAVTLAIDGSAVAIASGTAVTIPDGKTAVFSVKADYQIQSVTIDGAAPSTLSSYITITNPTDSKDRAYAFTAATPQKSGSHTLAVVFDHQIQMTADGAGRVAHTTGSGASVHNSGPEAVIADHGTTESFTFTADSDTCVTDVVVDGTSLGGFASTNDNYTGNTYSFAAVTASHTLVASFGSASITVLVGADDGAVGTDDDLYVQTHSPGWRAYKADASYNRIGAAFKEGNHGDAIAIPGDVSSCDAQYIVVEFLNIDGWQTPADININLQKNFLDQQVTGLYDADSHVLTVTANNGTVTRDPEGEAWVASNQRIYPQNTSVALTAASSAGWYFSLWKGDIGAATATDATISVTMDKDRSVEAVFVQPCQDNDSDGYTVGAEGSSCAATADQDCDDTNKNIYPGASEICGDGIDQNCNGSTDDACTGANKDDDGDGYTENQGDCNDANANIAPGKYDDPATSADEDCYDDAKEAGTELTCVSASDVPANAAVKPAPPLIMFLLDDSGSMDWEFMTSEDNQRFNGDGYVFPCNVIEKTYADSTYPALTTTERRLWKSQWSGYNRIYYNPAVTYTPWPRWEEIAENIRTHEVEYTPNATGATFPDTAYAEGYTHADMDLPRLNSLDKSGTLSAMYHPGDGGTNHSYYEIDLNAAYAVVYGGQQVIVTRDSSSTGTSTYADAIGLSTRSDIQSSVSRGYPVSSFSTTAVPYKPTIIFDNSDSTEYSEMGTWSNTTNDAQYAWNGDGRFTESTGNSAYWGLNLSTAEAGNYYVYAWVNEDSARDSNALYTLYYYNSSGVLTSATYRRDQSYDNGWGKTPRYGARWLRLNGSAIAFKAQSTSSAITIPNAHYYVLNDSDGDGVKDSGENVYLVTIPGSGHSVGDYSLHYYLFNDINGDNSVDNGELTEKTASEVPTSVIPARYDVAGKKITNADQLAYMVRQDFADWISFYRKRILTAKAAVGLTVEDMKGVALGIHTLNYSLSKPLVLMQVADSAEKLTYLKNIYSIRPDGSTYLRRALFEVGKYFEKGTSDDYAGLLTTSGLGSHHSSACTSSDDSVFWDAKSDDDTDACDDSGGECQRAYVIAMTDGYYNQKFYSLANIDSNSAYNTDAVFTDGVPYTLADVAMYFYKIDLDSSLGDNVPRKGFDDNAKQHMVTYTVAFGVAGEYKPDLFPDCLPKCDDPGTEGCPLISDLSNLAETSYSNTGGPYDNVCPTWWPDDPNATSNEGPRRVDDLFHAAVNSRGAFLNAADPAELVAAMQTIKDLIKTQTGTASSVSINANKIEENTLLFQSSYDTSDWNGDVVAKCLNSTGEIAACARVSCQVACSDSYDTCVSGCSNNAACETACATSKTSCVSSCTGSTCAETYSTCTADCATSSCETACSSAKNTCLENPPEVKWSASKQLDAVKATNRQIITADNTGNGLPFRWDDINATMKSQLSADQLLLDYLRGDSTYERKNDTAGIRNFRNRSSKLSDFINSEPYHYANTTLGIDWVVIGGNDGMLHVFDGTSGDEIFAFIPNTVFSSLSLLSRETYNDTHKFYVDGYMAVKNIGNKVILVGGLGKGGKGYFALDLTAAVKYKSDIEAHAADIVLWEYSTTSLAAYVDSTARNNLGYSFSRPQIIPSNDSAVNWAVVFGNGYESANGHAVFFALGLDVNGKISWSKIIDTGSGGSGSNCNGLSTPALIFPQGDSINDFAYAGDLLGNLWKFDLNATDKNNWQIYFENSSFVKQPLFQAKSKAGWRQPITVQPVVTAACPDKQRGYLIIFGTGRILDPSNDFLDLSVQTMYGVWDWSAAWKAAGAANPERTFLGAFGAENTSAISACGSVCSATLGTTVASGTCLYDCKGDSACESDCTADYNACAANCSDIRNLSNMTNVVGSTSSPYVTLLRQTQIWAGGINYNTDGTVAKTVYGATDLDLYDIISRIVSDNVIDWLTPSEASTFSASTAKTAKHVGWYFDLPANGERIVRDMTVTNGKLIFTSTIPSNSPCESGGTSYTWTTNACDGGRPGSAVFDLNYDNVLDSLDYINIGTEANPLYVPISGVGLKGITPAATLADVLDSDNDKLYTPGDAKSVNVNPTSIQYWREMKWKN